MFLLNEVLIAYSQHHRLNAHADNSKETSDVNVSLHLSPCFVYEEGKEVCWEISHTYSLVKVFASRQ